MRSSRLGWAGVLAIAGACGNASDREPDDPGQRTRAEAIALARSVRDHDAGAGARACAIVRDRAVDLRQPRIPELVSAAHAVLAATHTECPELAAALVDVACDPRLDCGADEDRRLCSPDDLEGAVERVLDALASGHEFPTDVDDRQVLLAAGHALPALPGRVRKQSDRRRYRVVQPDAPRCADAPADAPTPCKCLETPADVVEASCASTHSDEHDVIAGCRVRVDDDRHELVVLHRR